MKISSFIRPLGVAALAFVSLTACKRTADIPEDTHEHDEIAKVNLILTSLTDPTATQTITWQNGTLNGKLNLRAGQAYTTHLKFYNSKGTDVTSEIAEKEKEEHFIKYEAGDNLTLTRNADDAVRANGQKLGLKTTWITHSSSSASQNLRVILVHAPTSVNMNHPSEQNQLGTTTGGSNDVEITYPLTIEP